MTPVTERPKKEAQDGKPNRLTKPEPKGTSAAKPKQNRGDDTLVRSGLPPAEENPKSVPAVKQSQSTQKQTVLGMQAPPVQPPPKIEIVKETKPKPALSADRFTFDDLDFDTMVSSAQHSMGEKPAGTFPSNIVEKSPPPVSSEANQPEGTVSEKKADSTSEVPTVTLSTVPAPLTEPKSGRLRLIATAAIVILLASAAAAAYLAIGRTSGNEAPAQSAQRSADAKVSAPGPSTPIPTQPVAVQLPAPTPPVGASTKPEPKQETSPAVAPSTPSDVPESTPVEAASSVKTETPSATSTAATPSPAETPESTEPRIEKNESDGDTVRITLTGVPKRANIFLNGEPTDTPIVVPRGTKAVKVEVRLSGYDPLVKRVVPGNDKSVWIRLKKR